MRPTFYEIRPQVVADTKPDLFYMNEMNRPSLKLFTLCTILLSTCAIYTLNVTCKHGAASVFCTAYGATLYPPAGPGEMLLSEVASLFMCLIGMTVSMLSIAQGQRSQLRSSIVFLMLFIAAFVGENNIMRDDLRAQFLIVLLVWLGIELLIRRDFATLAILVVAPLIGVSGSLGDHGAQIEFEKVFGTTVGDSFAAPIAVITATYEEPLELVMWSLFTLAAVKSLDLRPPQRFPWRFTLLIVFAIIAFSVGDSFLHIRDNVDFEAERKFGFFLAAAGCATASAAAFMSYVPARDRAAFAYAGLFTLATYWLGVFAPAVYTHEHTKTISSWTWMMPLLGLYAFLFFANRHRTGEHSMADA